MSFEFANLNYYQHENGTFAISSHCNLEGGMVACMIACGRAKV